MYNYQGKKVLITGGGSGIGRSISLLFAQHEAEIIIFDLDNPTTNNTFEELKIIQPKTSLYFVDISNYFEVEKAANLIGNIDILINNAGISQIGNLENTSSEDFQKIFEVNVKGAFHCSKAFISSMKQQKSGVILNIASVAASVGIPDRLGYSMTKGAIKTMTMSIAKDYIKDGIRCNSISPARVYTPFVEGYLEKNYPENKEEMFNKLSATQPIGRMGQSDEIASMALYLCSNEASFLTGCDYPIDGGFLYLNN